MNHNAWNGKCKTTGLCCIMLTETMKGVPQPTYLTSCLITSEGKPTQTLQAVLAPYSLLCWQFLGAHQRIHAIPVLPFYWALFARLPNFRRLASVQTVIKSLQLRFIVSRTLTVHKLPLFPSAFGVAGLEWLQYRT
jgi:hypothetical protein